MSDKPSLTDDAQFYSELLRAYFDSAQDSIFVLCDEMKFLTCNKMTEKWLGYSEDQLTLHNKRVPITELLGESYDADKFGAFFQAALKGESISFETFISPPLGEERWVDVSLSRVDVDSGDMVIAIVRDISDRKKHLATIEYQLHYDELTGLPNRTFIIDYLNEFHFEKDSNQIASSHGLVLLVLDIDRFKEINETLGHKFGDFILREVARRLSRLTDESSGEFVARLGGDEFAIAFPNAGLSQSRITSQMIRQIVSQPFIMEGRKISLDCAIGIAALPTHTDDSARLIQLAEAAMYTAKSQKTGVSTYNSELSGASSERLQLVMDLRESLKKSHIKPFYQPIINMQTQVLHVEVLARWLHPKHGTIAPDVFIPLAEETGSIHKLTSRIMESALRNCAKLLNQQLVESISINISPYCLANPKLPAELKSYLESFSIQAGSVTLEITESVMMSDLPATKTNIIALHELGVAFSIDDFGTGYSSLSKLKLMPLKEIKIDKTFVMDIVQNENDSAITNAAIQMAHGLGLDVVAEGIEDESVWNCLREMGCDYGQGYWIAKPMPTHELESWVNNYHSLSKPSAV